MKYLTSQPSAHLIFSLALMVTVLFWTLLYDYKEAPSYANLFVHLLQSVVVLVDQ